MNDPIVDEIRRHRKEMAEAYRFDLAAMIAELKRREAETPGPVRKEPLKPRRAPLKQAATE